MIFRARVLAGVEPDPSVFWSDGLSGAVDLVTLVLTSDVNHNIDATLTLGMSTPEFLLTFSGTGNAESAIETSFVGTGGVLPVDLDDLFSAGFVPSASVSEFTVGLETSLAITANEVPEPVSMLLFGSGLAAMLAWKRRRQASFGNDHLDTA
jgi:hypothetical protein